MATVPGKDKGSLEEKDLPPAIELPGFARAIPGVASGIKPFPDGINWLVEKGYKSVLHLHGPGEELTATRRLFEKKGLTYKSLEASPARLTKEVYERFVELVNDRALHPMYVWDKDGSMAGALWYLYFRVQRNQDDETARTEAQRLGLRFDDDAEHKAAMLAAQKLREALKP